MEKSIENLIYKIFAYLISPHNITVTFYKVCQVLFPSFQHVDITEARIAFICVSTTRTNNNEEKQNIRR